METHTNVNTSDHGKTNVGIKPTQSFVATAYFKAFIIIPYFYLCDSQYFILWMHLPDLEVKEKLGLRCHRAAPHVTFSGRLDMIDNGKCIRSWGDHLH